MEKFPQSVIDVMTAGGATVTCLPVQLEEPAEENSASEEVCWQSAVFFRLGGNESTRDIRLLRSGSKAYGVGIETDIIEHENASVVMLRLQLFVQPDDPLIGEVLLTPGGAETHYEVLGLLGNQQTLTWFCSDQEYNLIHQQQQPLSDEWRQEFLALRAESFKRDAILRLAGKYSAQTAFAEIVSNYGLR
ncbi:hypothetical protein AB833_23365 [Chromatiales bacterium (ex Bugula neritina AB1)]|nr:hypothetical protein AB833_23365 [Chromatiales bacterium (ex Bugula neritina AB1)]